MVPLASSCSQQHPIGLLFVILIHDCYSVQIFGKRHRGYSERERKKGLNDGMIMKTGETICGFVKRNRIRMDLYALESDRPAVSGDPIWRCRSLGHIHCSSPFLTIVPHLMPNARLARNQHPALSQSL